ncbi:hypothetical protein KI387_019972, partial [Taxus chinensis]
MLAHANCRNVSSRSHGTSQGYNVVVDMWQHPSVFVHLDLRTSRIELHFPLGQ